MDKSSPFYVPPLLHLVGGFIDEYPHFWRSVAQLESKLLAAELSANLVRRPIYICGLARSGSTLLHEIITAHPGVASHRMRDYPLVLTPFWWRSATANQPAAPARERAHGDRMMVSAESPDALEEMVWLAFFPQCHNPAVNNVITAAERHPAFETFYRNHLGKLLLVEKANRYAAKANYHVARLTYLLRLFPDARFLIPVRDSVTHIGSLMRQQQRFSAGQRKYARSLAFMRRTGHFEFGLDRRPINLGDTSRVQAIQQAWARGEEALGWAWYWAMVHEYLAQLLAENESLRQAVVIVRFEDMCDDPAQVLGSVLRHAALPDAETLIARFAPSIRRPDYYQNPLSQAEEDLIRQETASVARMWGYK